MCGPANFSNFCSLRAHNQGRTIVDTRHELSQHEMESLREIVDSTRISRHLKSIQIGIVSGFTIFKSSTPNKFQRGYSSLLTVYLFSVFCFFAPKASDHIGYRVESRWYIREVRRVRTKRARAERASEHDKREQKGIEGTEL